MKPLFCPLPCGKRASLLSKNLRSKLKESLEYLVDINKNELSTDYLVWREAVARIKPGNKISSFYYFLNSLLLHETTTNTVATIASYINYLSQDILDDQHLIFLNYAANSQDNVKLRIQKKYILFDLPENASIDCPDNTSAEKIKELVEEALQLIRGQDEDYYQEMLTLVSELLILKTDSLKAGSSFDIFGMIYINAANASQSVINMVDLLIHETAHFYLHSLSVDDPLVLNDYEERFFSPIRGSNRPMIGIYHAAFVLFRVLKFLSFLTKYRVGSEAELDAQGHSKKIAADTMNPQGERSEAIEENNNMGITQALDRKEIATLNIKYSKIVAESLETIEKFGKLTELGKKLIEATRQEFLALTFEENPA